MVVRLEVRCCCQPQKLLGWLEVPDYLVRAGREIAFMIPPVLSGSPWAVRTYEITPERRVMLPVAEFHPGEGMPPYLALKSEETSLEVLRQIRGFVEHEIG